MLMMIWAAGCGTPAGHEVNKAAFEARPSYSDEASRNTVRQTFDRRQERQEDYRVGAGDVLEISIFEWELRGETRTAEFRVAESGIISLPVVGDLDVTDHSVAEVRRRIEDKLSSEGYLKEPRVTVNVVDYRSKRVGVVGAVNDPGVYVLRENATTLLQVLSLAGGVSDRAGQVAYVGLADRSVESEQDTDEGPEESDDSEEKSDNSEEESDEIEAGNGDGDTKTVELSEEGAQVVEEAGFTGDEVVPIDLYQLLELGDMSLNMVLQDGDTVYVPRAKSVSVIGFVQQPGSFALTEPMRILDAIAMANGVIEQKASPGACVLKRQTEDGQKLIPIDLTQIAEGEDPNLYLRPYDVVVVRQTTVKRVYEDTMDFIRGIVGVGYSLN